MTSSNRPATSATSGAAATERSAGVAAEDEARALTNPRDSGGQFVVDAVPNAYRGVCVEFAIATDQLHRSVTGLHYEQAIEWIAVTYLRSAVEASLREHRALLPHEFRANVA